MKKSSQAIKWEELPELVRKMNPHLAPGASVADTGFKLTPALAAAVKTKPVSEPKPKKQRARGPNGEKYRSELEREFHEWLKGRGKNAYASGYVEFEPIRLKLAERSHYTPDFVTADGFGRLFAWEAKGHWREAARVRIKVAARLFWMYEFIAVRKRKKKDGGGWEFEHIKTGEKSFYQ